jgi:hypothetical protein
MQEGKEDTGHCVWNSRSCEKRKVDIDSSMENSPGVDGRIILGWIFRKWDVGYGLDWAGSGWRQVAGNCDCGNEPSGPIKCG